MWKVIMSTKDFSSTQEHKVAEFLGEEFHVVAGSGANSAHPGDVVSEHYIIECKTHTTKDYKIIFNHKVWDKIKQEAISQRKTPVLVTDDGSQDISKTWIIMDNKMMPLTIKKFLATEQIVKYIGKATISVPESELSDIYFKRFRDFGDDAIAYIGWDARTTVAIMPIQKFKDIILKER